jgi:hypothetical protein
LAEGSFGNRPTLRDDLAIDDVLSALRLFKSTLLQTAGHASWTESFFLSGGTSFRVLREWPYGGRYDLAEAEIPQFLELWHLLEEGAARFSFSIHRFNLAFDRRLIADRLVDLVIAGESLFLGDINAQDRGELRFRFALRAAKFIQHSVYSEGDIFRVMRNAYDVRSAIVHGGSPKDTSLPDNKSATLPVFIDVIEELVRRALRKALSMKLEGKKATATRLLGRPSFPQPQIGRAAAVAPVISAERRLRRVDLLGADSGATSWISHGDAQQYECRPPAPGRMLREHDEATARVG